VFQLGAFQTDAFQHGANPANTTSWPFQSDAFQYAVGSYITKHYKPWIDGKRPEDKIHKDDEEVIELLTLLFASGKFH
jgi:hypothetical protein